MSKKSGLTLSAFIDESSDETRNEVFAVGAFLANEAYWKAVEASWLRRLARDGISYFRTADCKSLGGPFRPLVRKYGSVARAREVADELRSDLENILLSQHWIGFGLGILMQDYQEAFHVTPATRMMYSDDPTEAAYSQIMFEIARSAQTNAPEADVAYVVDDSSYSEKISAAFNAVRRNHPTVAETMKSVTASDDRVNPPLQAADLVASVIKDGFLGWLKSGRDHTTMPDKWFSTPNHFEVLGIWDKEHMLRSVRETISSKKLFDGRLAQRIARKMTKTERKRLRKALIAKMTTQR